MFFNAVVHIIIINFDIPIMPAYVISIGICVFTIVIAFLSYRDGKTSYRYGNIYFVSRLRPRSLYIQTQLSVRLAAECLCQGDVGQQVETLYILCTLSL